MRPPEEIAAACERLAERVAADEYVVDEEIALFREAAEALREAVEQWELWENSRNTNYTTAGIAIKRAEQAEADRDALLAVAQAAHVWFRLTVHLYNNEERAALRSAFAALPEHLRRQVES
jgi:hypothetical protein